jgi:hypothetical protein
VVVREVKVQKKPTLLGLVFYFSPFLVASSGTEPLTKECSPYTENSAFVALFSLTVPVILHLPDTVFNFYVTNKDQTSIFPALNAFDSIKFLRGSTSSPISVVKI